MHDKDRRKLTNESLNDHRKYIGTLILKGMPSGEIATYFNVWPSIITKYKKICIEGGLDALKLKTRGRKKGGGTKLTIENERHIISKMIDMIPDEDVYAEKRFWTRENVQAFIKRELNITLSISSIGNYLGRWGFLNKKSVLLDKKIKASKSKTWLMSKYPSIKSRAQQENAVIYWAHDYNRIRFLDLLMKKSKLNDAWKVKCYMLEIIGPYGRKSFILSSGRHKVYELITWLENLIKYSNKKIYLMLNIPKIYPIKPLKAWLNENIESIEVYYVPQ